MLRNKMLQRGLLTAVILALFAMVVYDQISLHREPTQYHLDIQTEDFAINNINLVSTPNHVYIAGGYFLERTEGDTTIDQVIIDGRVTGERVFDWSFSEPFYRSDISPVSEGTVLGGIQLDSKSVLHMKVTYTIRGKTKEYKEDIKLHDKTKPFSSTIANSYKIYEIIPRVATKPSLN